MLRVRYPEQFGGLKFQFKDVNVEVQGGAPSPPEVEIAQEQTALEKPDTNADATTLTPVESPFVALFLAKKRQDRAGTVPLSDIEYAGYYLGYANSVLWPAFHNRLDLAKFEAGFFERFVDVNRRLAGLLQPMLGPNDVIWVHDYELIPFAAELRRRGVTNPIGFFLHIPFPPP